jgi:hypothetical protein
VRQKAPQIRDMQGASEQETKAPRGYQACTHLARRRPGMKLMNGRRQLSFAQFRCGPVTRLTHLVVAAIR